MIIFSLQLFTLNEHSNDLKDDAAREKFFVQSFPVPLFPNGAIEIKSHEIFNMLFGD